MQRRDVLQRLAFKKIYLHQNRMKNISAIQSKILNRDKVKLFARAARTTSKTIAFTNGCFDILHEGHIYSLSHAAREADILIVGLNSDSSVRKLKGEHRPINNEHSRSLILASLLIVDVVVVFPEDTPLELIKVVRPDVFVKGGDYTIDQIAGAKEVIEWGGRVIINPIIKGFSTTGLIEKIKTL
jgi:D-glycero-beta-D-manno-heptose 1-phosphate adenylyltransferase